jgi:hypothetical protein
MDQLGLGEKELQKMEEELSKMKSIFQDIEAKGGERRREKKEKSDTPEAEISMESLYLK